MNPAQKYLQINNTLEQVWKFETNTYCPPVTFRRTRDADFGSPVRTVKTVHGKISYYLEVFLTGRVLLCWTDTRIEAKDVSGIDTVSERLLLTNSNIVPCRIVDRQPTEKEHEFIQQERLIDSNYAKAATPMNSTKYIYIAGNAERIYLDSQDHSVNYVNQKELFTELRRVAETRITSENDRRKVVGILTEMEACKDKASFFSKQAELVSYGANWMTILSPFFPALTGFGQTLT